MTSRPEPCTLLAATDLLSTTSHLVEAIYMAAGDLNADECEAIRSVCNIVQPNLSKVQSIVDALRAEGMK